MRIKRFEFESTQSRWRLSPVSFSDLTLLVGLSGVGKTRILKSINSLVGVSEGKSRSGIKWSIDFLDDEGRDCTWSGEFERLDEAELVHEQFEFMSDEDGLEKKKARLISEQVIVSGKIVVNRTSDMIAFQGTKMPKLSPHESVVSLFKEEDEIRPVAKSFSRIVYSYRAELVGFDRMFALTNSDRLAKKYRDIEAVKQSSLSALAKLYLADIVDRKVFNEISDRFVGVFPNVEEVSFAKFDKDGAPDFFPSAVYVRIKERGVQDFIAQKDISSGMLRTLSHLAELYLSPPGTVILIDEFENSFGVNCIDAVTEDLLDASSNIQFIITSHHPYIINNVSADFWKVVCRNGSEVNVVDAADLGIGASSHDAFLQLLNSDRYISGISACESK